MSSPAAVQEADAQTKPWSGAKYVIYDGPHFTPRQVDALTTEFPQAQLIAVPSPQVKLCATFVGRHFMSLHNDGDVVIVAHGNCPEFASRFTRPSKSFLAHRLPGYLLTAARNVAKHVGTTVHEPTVWGLLIDDQGDLELQCTRNPAPHRRALAGILGGPALPVTASDVIGRQPVLV